MHPLKGEFFSKPPHPVALRKHYFFSYISTMIVGITKSLLITKKLLNNKLFKSHLF